MDRVNSIFEKGKVQILEDIVNNIVPQTITSFADLHDYVDANCYGGFCEDGYEASPNFEVEQAVQQRLDEWIKSNEFTNQKQS